MVSINVAQLLQAPPGETRDFDFEESGLDLGEDLDVRSPVRGHAHLLRTSAGVLVISTHRALVALECARCLNELEAEVEGSLEEEFLPSTDIRTGVPVNTEVLADPDQPRITENHEIQLDEMLRQTLITGLPFQPLCEAACPGLCAQCGQRLDERHKAHKEAGPETGPTAAGPFAGLADMLKDLDGEP